LRNIACDTIVQRLVNLGDQRRDGLAYTEIDGKGQAIGSLTYGELAQEVVSCSAGLVERKLRGERVIVALRGGLEFVTTFFACLHAGAIPVVVEPPRRPRSHQLFQAVVADCRPKLLISGTDFDAGLDWSTPQELRSRFATWTPPRSQDLAYLQYTSGSTSNPKGVMVTHSNILANNRALRQLCGQTDGVTLVSWLPVFHDMGLVSKVLQSVYLAGHCVLMGPATFAWKPSLWLKTVSRYRAHTSGAPNFAFELVVERMTEQDCEGLDLSCWKTAYCAAEPVRFSTMRRFVERFSHYGFSPTTFKPAYGLAEFTLCATMVENPTDTPRLTVDRDELCEGVVKESGAGATYVNCGTPAEETSVVILEPDGELKLPADTVGEIALSGPSTTPGYWGQTPRRGLLRTGDLGFLRDGSLFVVGRKKDLIIIAGRNLHPEDVEHTVEQAHEQIRAGSCAAYSLDDGESEHLVIAIELRRGDKQAIENAVRESVNMCHDVSVSGVVFVRPGELPRTSSGKVRRGACAEILAKPDTLSQALHSPDSPAHPVEKYLCERLAKKAGCSSVEPTAKFKELGLDSVFRFTLMGELARALGVPVPGDATWLYETPQALARALDAKSTGELEVIRVGQPGPVVLVQAIGGGITWSRNFVPAFSGDWTIVAVRQGPKYYETLEALAADSVSKLTARFSTGPYTIVGYSQFTRLAFEIARQLREQGVEVELLVAIDGSATQWRSMPPLEYLRQFCNRLLWQAVQVARKKGFQGLLIGLQGAVENVRRILRAALGRVTSSECLPEHSIDPNDTVANNNLRLATLYQPKRDPGDVLVYRAPDKNFSGLFMKDAGWGHVAEGGVRIVDVPGDHFSILQTPVVDFIANDIDRELRLRRYRAF
jgi:acyl-CoA synthetase (AMP-forming)/AMP-acid ligase II/thioesterase domain-containing protein/acyl carrier protein